MNWFFSMRRITLFVLVTLATFCTLFTPFLSPCFRRWYLKQRGWHTTIRILAAKGRAFAFGTLFAMILVWFVTGSVGICQLEPLCQLDIADLELGLWGSVQLIFSRILEFFYRLLSLLIGNQLYLDPTHPDPPFMLSISRFAGTLSFSLFIGGGLGQWFLKSLAKQISRYLLYDHVVIIGLGSEGRSLMADLASRNTRRRMVEDTRESQQKQKQDRDEAGNTITRAHIRKPRNYLTGGATVGMDFLEAKLEKARAARLGALIMAGDGDDSQNFDMLATHKAAAVFIATGSDSRNLEISGKIREHHADKKNDRWWCLRSLRSLSLRIVPVINDSALRQRVRADQRFLGLSSDRADAHVVSIDPFSTNETAVRQLFRNHRIDELAYLTPARRAHLLIVGFGNLGETLLLQGLQAALHPALQPPRFTVLAEPHQLAQRESQFVERFPGMKHHIVQRDTRREEGEGVVSKIEIEFVPCNLEVIGEAIKNGVDEYGAGEESDIQSLPDLLAGEGTNTGGTSSEITPRWPLQPVTGIFICIESDDTALSTAISLQIAIDRQRCCVAPTFVQLYENKSLAQALKSSDEEVELSQVIQAFGLNRKVCTYEEILLQRIQYFANDLDDQYLGSSNELYKRWPREYEKPEEESENTRFLRRAHFNSLGPPRTYDVANLAQAVHVDAKLRALGFRLVEAKESSAGTAISMEAQRAWENEENGSLEQIGLPGLYGRLAQLEHERWMLERATDGWRHGTERDNLEKRHPDLIPWEELARAVQRQDEAHVLNLDKCKSWDRDGLVWKKDVRIGSVGSCKLSEGEDCSATAQIEEALQAMARELHSDDTVITLVSPLAPGADIIFVEVALRVFKGFAPRLIIPRPAPYDDKGNYAARRSSILSSDNSQANEKARDRANTPQVARRAWWMVDLLPPGYSERCVRVNTINPVGGEELAELRRKFREQQYWRATAYLVERCDRILFVHGPQGSTHASKAYDWWTGEEPIPPKLSSIAGRYTFGNDKTAPVIITLT